MQKRSIFWAGLFAVLAGAVFQFIALELIVSRAGLSLTKPIAVVALYFGGCLVLVLGSVAMANALNHKQARAPPILAGG
jgi:hypothetical protein